MYCPAKCLGLSRIPLPSSDNGDNVRTKRVHNTSLNIIISPKTRIISIPQDLIMEASMISHNTGKHDIFRSDMMQTLIDTYFLPGRRYIIFVLVCISPDWEESF
jgi:hypothetical protein